MKRRMSRRGAVLGLIGAMMVMVLGTTSGMAADNGTVDAEVTIEQAAACLELSTGSIDFGTLALGAENAPATPGITVSNCASADATVFASGTNAFGAGATWNLTDSGATCSDTLGTDNYHLGLATPLGASIATLSTSNKEVGTLAGAGNVDHVARISTACPGSSGAGQSMTMQINYLATNVATPPIVLEEISATQENADLVAAFLAPASKDHDIAPSCGVDTVACPGGVPSDPLPRVRVEASNVSTVQVPATTRWTMSAVLDVATLDGIPVTIQGVSCTVNVDSSLGSSPTFGASAALDFQSYPNPAGPTNYVAVGNANISGVETADIDITGGLSCDLAALFASLFIGQLQDQIEAYLEGNICGAPEPAVFMACPALP